MKNKEFCSLGLIFFHTPVFRFKYTFSLAFEGGGATVVGGARGSKKTRENLWYFFWSKSQQHLFCPFILYHCETVFAFWETFSLFLSSPGNNFSIFFCCCSREKSWKKRKQKVLEFLENLRFDIQNIDNFVV